MVEQSNGALQTAEQVSLVVALMFVLGQVLGDKLNRVKPIFCLVFGVAVALLHGPVMWQTAVLRGVIVGLTAAGAYRTGNVVINNK